MAELLKAKKVVQATMKHQGAKLLFNQPVDPEALGLPDYLKVVKTPIDLGTIVQRLTTSNHYTSASQVVFSSGKQSILKNSCLWGASVAPIT